MTSTAVESSPSLTIAPTQNTAPVLEFRCLFTHDLRRKAKRWQDGFLRYHTFNRRVMVYDMPRNYIGDMHWRQSDQIDEGDEFQLDKGVLVEVGESLGRTEQDVTDVVAKKKTPNPVNASSPHVPATRPLQNAATNSQLRPKSLNELLGIHRAPIGRANLPQKSPFEQRQSENLQNNLQEDEQRPPKRRKVASEVPHNLRSLPLGVEMTGRRYESKTNRPTTSSLTSAISPRQRAIEISEDEGESARASIPITSRLYGRQPRPSERSNGASLTKTASKDRVVHGPPKAKTAQCLSDKEPAATPSRSKDKAEFIENEKEQRELERQNGAEKRKEAQKKRAAERRKELKQRKKARKLEDEERQAEAEQQREEEPDKRLDIRERRDNEQREKAEKLKAMQQKQKQANERHPSPPSPQNILRFAPSKVRKRLMYKDLLPKPKDHHLSTHQRTSQLEDLERETAEGEARIRARLQRRIQNNAPSRKYTEPKEGGGRTTISSSPSLTQTNQQSAEASGSQHMFDPEGYSIPQSPWERNQRTEPPSLAPFAPRSNSSSPNDKSQSPPSRVPEKSVSRSVGLDEHRAGTPTLAELDERLLASSDLSVAKAQLTKRVNREPTIPPAPVGIPPAETTPANFPERCPPPHQKQNSPTPPNVVLSASPTETTISPKNNDNTEISVGNLKTRPDDAVDVLRQAENIPTTEDQTVSHTFPQNQYPPRLSTLLRARHPTQERHLPPQLGNTDSTRASPPHQSTSPLIPPKQRSPKIPIPPQPVQNSPPLPVFPPKPTEQLQPPPHIARTRPQIQAQPRRQPPRIRTVIMRTNSVASNTSVETTTSNESESPAGAWSGINAWSAEGWDMLGWWPESEGDGEGNAVRPRPAGVPTKEGQV